MRIRRTLTAAALAAAAAASLTACDTNVGLAAAVDGARLTDSALSGFVQKGAGPYTDQSTGATVDPKSFALEAWIDDQLFRRAVDSKGGAPSAQQYTAAESAVLANSSMDSVRSLYGKDGYTPALADMIIHSNAALVLLVERLAPGVSASQAVSALQSGQAGTVLFKAVAATKPTVRVSARYGTWDAAKLAMSSGPGAGLPSFVQYHAASSSGTVPAPVAP